MIRRASHETDPDDVVIEVDRGQQAGPADTTDDPADTTDDPAVPVQLSESQPAVVVVTPKSEQVPSDCRERRYPRQTRHPPKHLRDCTLL